MSSWSNLPHEILLVIFSQRSTNILTQSDILCCISVCKGWKRAAECSAYRKIVLYGKSQAKQLIAAMNCRDHDFSKYVKRIQFSLFYSKDGNLFYETFMGELAILFPYVKTIEGGYSETENFYKHLLHVLLDGKWKLLKKNPDRF